MICTRAFGLALASCVLGAWAFAGAAPVRSEKQETVADILRAAKTAPYLEDRDQAIKKLGDITDVNQLDTFGVVQFLLELAQAPGTHPRLRDRAIRSLGRLTFRTKTTLREKFMSPFAKVLENKKEDANIRFAILEVFRDELQYADVRDQKTMESVETVAADKQEDVWIRIAAFECMGTVGTSDKGFKTILGNLREGTPELKNAVLDSLLRRIQETEAQLEVATVNTLIEIVKDKAVKVDARVSAMKVIAANGRKGGPGKGATKDIIEIMQKADEMPLIVGAVEAVGLIADETALPSMLKLTEEKFFTGEEGVPARIAICRALGNCVTVFEAKSKSAAESVGTTCRDQLIKYMTTDKSVAVRQKAAYNLGLMTAPAYDSLKGPAVDALLDELYDLRKQDSSDLKDCVIDALRFITRANFGADVDKWDEWYQNKYGRARPREKKPKPEEK